VINVLTRFKPIFSPAGAVILVIALVILIRALLARNAYEIVLSSAALVIMLLFCVVGVWKSQKLKLMEPGWKPPFPMTAGLGSVCVSRNFCSARRNIFADAV
jgi:hypothetical protein